MKKKNKKTKAKKQKKERQRHEPIGKRDITAWPRQQADVAAETVAQELSLPTPLVREDIHSSYGFRHLVQPYDDLFGRGSADPRSGTRLVDTFVDAAIAFLARFGVDFRATYRPLDRTSLHYSAQSDALLQRLTTRLPPLFDAPDTRDWRTVVHVRFSIALQEQYKAAQHKLDAVYRALASSVLCKTLEQDTYLPLDIIGVIASFEPHPLLETISIILNERRQMAVQSWREGQQAEIAAALPHLAHITDTLAQFTKQRPFSITKQYKKGTAKKQTEGGERVHHAYDFVRVGGDQWSAMVDNIGTAGKETIKELIFFYGQKPYDVTFRTFSPPRAETRYGTDNSLRSRNPRLEIDLAEYL